MWVQLGGLLTADRPRLGTDARLHGEVRGKVLGNIALRSEDEVARIDPAAIGVGVAKRLAEVRERLQAAHRELGVGGNRVVGADDGAGLRGAARAGLGALQQKYAVASEFFEVERGRRPDHAATDHHRVIYFTHHPTRRADIIAMSIMWPNEVRDSRYLRSADDRTERQSLIRLLALWRRSPCRTLISARVA